MQLEKIFALVKQFERKEQEEWMTQVFRLFEQFYRGVALNPPYRLVLDSNILMRLEDAEKGNYNVGNLAIFTFFNYIHSQSSWVSDIVIRPPVLFEFWRRSNVQSLKEYWPKFKEVNDLIERFLEVQPMYESVETFEQAQKHIAKITADENQLKESLLKIERRDWHVSFVWNHGDGVMGNVGKNDNYIYAWPSSVAEKFVRVPILRFFDKLAVRQVLVNHITAKIYENDKNDPHVLDYFRAREDFSLKNFFKLSGKNKNVKGLADLDLFAIGNIQQQFHMQSHNRYFPVTIPLSIDEDLERALEVHSTLSVHSQIFQGGDDEAVMQSKSEQAARDGKRLNKATERQERFFNDRQPFLKKLISEIFPEVLNARQSKVQP
jgi:hypothetical protein